MDPPLPYFFSEFGCSLSIAGFAVESLTKFQADDLEARWNGFHGKIIGPLVRLRKAANTDILQFGQVSNSVHRLLAVMRADSMFSTTIVRLNHTSRLVCSKSLTFEFGHSRWLLGK